MATKGRQLKVGKATPVVTTGSPTVNKGSPRFRSIVNNATQGRQLKATQVGSTKKANKETQENKRASSNTLLEKSLVDLLHEHNTIHYRGQNGWSSESWNKIVKEFHQKNTYVSYTKSQIQEKEKELKREYRILREARMQSGVGWNDTRSMIEAEDALWNNLVISFPKINRFKTKSFPLFDALGELYDGQIAEGTYNINSTQPPKYPDLTQADDGDELSHTESEFPRFEETWAYNVEQDAYLTEHVTIEDEDGSVARTEPRTEESEKKGAQSGDYSIKRCISENDDN
ncbi:hypothetical protein ACQ4PT_007055 [Festuca glaucescens]